MSYYVEMLTHTSRGLHFQVMFSYPDCFHHNSNLVQVRSQSITLQALFSKIPKLDSTIIAVTIYLVCRLPVLLALLLTKKFIFSPEWVRVIQGAVNLTGVIPLVG